mmetsp:Transcript_108452/g.324314  ORF Transcript_108452/g.324314 Transcript_108452/m.324314 type:complete len:305 (-) Transcript_108452:1426-2340(-)
MPLPVQRSAHLRARLHRSGQSGGVAQPARPLPGGGPLLGLWPALRLLRDPARCWRSSGGRPEGLLGGFADGPKGGRGGRRRLRPVAGVRDALASQRGLREQRRGPRAGPVGRREQRLRLVRDQAREPRRPGALPLQLPVALGRQREARLHEEEPRGERQARHRQGPRVPQLPRPAVAPLLEGGGRPRREPGRPAPGQRRRRQPLGRPVRRGGVVAEAWRQHAADGGAGDGQVAVAAEAHPAAPEHPQGEVHPLSLHVLRPDQRALGGPALALCHEERAPPSRHCRALGPGGPAQLRADEEPRGR